MNSPSLRVATTNRFERRRERTRRDLLAAAVRVLAKKGLHDTKVADIAAAADIGVGTFYLHFPTKDALFDAVVEDTVVRLKGVPDRVRSRGRVQRRHPAGPGPVCRRHRGDHPGRRRQPGLRSSAAGHCGAGRGRHGDAGAVVVDRAGITVDGHVGSNDDRTRASRPRRARARRRRAQRRTFPWLTPPFAPPRSRTSRGKACPPASTSTTPGVTRPPAWS
ncbi:MAG: helix-turn-helix transcriptional regulator [Deltaproteobacteria bacterium]|nr:MAG: helix-turn-helix transcriptional regulator [Deltaproteobacteria bacterium]